MKPIFEIGRAELKKMFFSPVAWLVLIAFAFQVFNQFSIILSTIKVFKINTLQAATLHFFATGNLGGKFFIHLQGSISMFIPLLTMNVMSREYNMGTIRLLYSSPVSNVQIVMGKYLSLVYMALLMMALIAIPSVYLALHISNVEWALIGSGLLGLFLLTCCYAAIGLFVSSLTSYAIISVIASIAILFFLNLVGNMAQETPFLREIAWWLSIRGRSEEMVQGMISSNTSLYFLTVIGLFLSLTLVKLHAVRGQKSGGYIFRQYLFVVVATCAIAWFSSLPAMKIYGDVTRSKVNTLSKESQRLLRKVEDGLTITSYSNMLNLRTNHIGTPADFMSEKKRYEPFIRFKPSIRLDYQYYYHYAPNQTFNNAFGNMTAERIMDSLKQINDWDFDIVPFAEMPNKADLASEKYRFFAELKRDNGQRSFLRVFEDLELYPSEQQISAAIKRMVEPVPLVGFVTGHGERSIAASNESGYQIFAAEKTFRHSMLNTGYDVEQIDLSRPVPVKVQILVIADSKLSYTETEMANLKSYIDRGDNLLITAEPGRNEVMSGLLAELGVKLLPGVLVQPKPSIVPEVVFSNATPAIGSVAAYLTVYTGQPRAGILTNTTAALTYQDHHGFEVKELFKTSTLPTWNELETKDLKADSAIFNPAAGEQQQSWTTALSLTRKQAGKQQKIIVTGDADWLDNKELATFRRGFHTINFYFLAGIFYYLSDGVLPVSIARAPATDTKVHFNHDQLENLAVIAKWGIPAVLLLAALFVLIRRKGR